jgi:hypothetical protein
MKEYKNDDMPHKRIFHLVCSCFRTPGIGSFSVGQEYTFECTLATVRVLDDLGQVIVFNEKVFEHYFCNFGDPIYPVTSLQPSDKTIYHLYFILDQNHCNFEAIKAYSKLFNVNYIQAKSMLNAKRVLIATGNAHNIKEILGKLKGLQINYEISPPYPYQF